MANKIIYDINGKIKDIATTHMSASDDGNSLFINKLSFNTASVNLPNGLLIVGADGNISSSAGSRDGDIVSWNVASGSWIVKPDEINISTLTASSGDLYPNESYNNIRVKSLSNVSFGTLGVANGGTGIAKGDIIALGSTDEALLVGNGTLPMVMIKQSDQGDLSKKPVLTTNSTENGWTHVTQSVMQVNMDIQVFNTPGSYTWNKPANTKMIRVLAQGGGGGGGSGANRNKLVNFLGGAGGSGGAFVDSGIISFNDSQVSITVGSGGIGANIPYNHSAGLSGLDGESSSFGSYIIANGGRGGGGGNINSSTTSSGGLPATGSSQLRDVLVYNMNSFTLSNVSGSPNTLTIGNNANSDSYLLTQRGGSSGGSNSYNGGYGLYDLSETDFTSSYLFYFNSNTSVSNLANSSYGLTIQNSSGFAISNDSPFNDGTKSLQVIVPSLTVPYINLSNLPNSSYNDFTYEVWAYFSSFATNYSCLLTTLLTATPTYLRLNVLSNGKIQCGYVNATGGAFESQYTTTTSVQLNKWTHIALCRKGNNMYIFIDGISHQFTLSLFRTFKLDSQVIFLGVQGSNAQDQYKASAKYCNFRITDKCIYNSSFNTSEIILSSNKTSSLYQESYLLTESDLNLSNSNYSINNGIYIHNGSTGGDSYSVTETFDSGTYALYHANLNNPTTDNSIYGQNVLSGSASGTKIISTGSLGIPQLSGSGWSDGVVSSSYFQQAAGTASSLYISPGYNAGTGPWSLESWFYLKNAGTSGVTGVNAASCYLFGAGYTGGSVGTLLFVTSSAGSPKLRIWSGAYDTVTSSNNMPINEWCHIVLQKSGSNLQVYINGTSSINKTIASTVNGTFGYSLGATTAALQGGYNFNGYAKELKFLNRAQSPAEIAQNYTNVILNNSGPYNDISFVNEYPGGTGGDGACGSGGGGGGASTNITGSLIGTRQGGNGGDGYVAVISYKDF